MELTGCVDRLDQRVTDGEELGMTPLCGTADDDGMNGREENQP